MSPQLPYVSTGLHDLRWMALSEAAQASGKSERQLQRWAAKDKSLVRRRERGHTVEYCLDDVLAVVGRAPIQQRITQQHRRIAELEHALTEMEVALTDAQVRSRTQRTTLQRIQPATNCDVPRKRTRSPRCIRWWPRCKTRLSGYGWHGNHGGNFDRPSFSSLIVTSVIDFHVRWVQQDVTYAALRCTRPRDRSAKSCYHVVHGI